VAAAEALGAAVTRGSRRLDGAETLRFAEALRNLGAAQKALQSAREDARKAAGL
jgi:hypothetical protein